MDGGLFYCCHSQTFPFLRIIYWILFSILFSKFSNIHNFEIFFLDFLYMVSPFKKNVTVPQETIHTRTVFKTIYKSGRRPCIEHHVIRQNLDFTTDLKVQHVPNDAINSWNLKNNHTTCMTYALARTIYFKNVDMDGALFYCSHSQIFPFLRIIY